jgi:hypothetical protein
MKLIQNLSLVVLVLCAPVWAASVVAQDGTGPEFHWQGAIPDGKAIEIKGINGEVRAEAASGNQVEVVAVKRWGRSAPETVNVEVVEHAGGVTVCAVYPQRNGEPGRCKPGAGGQSAYNNDVKVEFTVRVPAGVRFIGRTFNGNVRAEALGSNVEARTVNGSINVRTAGHAQASTVNGSINVACGRADWNEPLEFNTVNGSIDLALPASARSEIHARTVNGKISSDLPLMVRGSVSARQLDGVIGGEESERQLKMETVNGSIRVTRAL